MKTSLLELVKTTLSRMNSDQVLAIDDTEESRQVALICRHVYEELEMVREWGHKTEIVELDDNPGEVAAPFIPDDVSRIEQVQYREEQVDGSLQAKTLKYVRPEDWLNIVATYDTTDTETSGLLVSQAYGNPTETTLFRVGNTKHPDYWTSINNEYMLFDSFNSEFESKIDVERLIVLGQKIWTFDETDDTLEIHVPSNDWPLYRNMVLSRAYIEIKQTNHPAADQIVRRLMIRAQKSSNHTTNRGQRGVNYGR